MAEKSGYIYVLEGGGYFKIGLSKDIDRRISEISPKLPFDVRLVHALIADDMYKAERYLHDKFASKRTKGEWFKLEQKDLEWVTGLFALREIEGDEIVPSDDPLDGLTGDARDLVNSLMRTAGYFVYCGLMKDLFESGLEILLEMVIPKLTPEVRALLAERLYHALRNANAKLLGMLLGLEPIQDE